MGLEDRLKIHLEPGLFEWLAWYQVASNQSISHLTNQSINQSIIQLTNQSIDHPINVKQSRINSWPKFGSKSIYQTFVQNIKFYIKLFKVQVGKLIFYFYYSKYSFFPFSLFSSFIFAHIYYTFPFLSFDLVKLLL